MSDVASPKKGAATKKAAAPRKVPSHPPYKEMVAGAIAGLVCGCYLRGYIYRFSPLMFFALVNRRSELGPLARLSKSTSSPTTT